MAATVTKAVLCPKCEGTKKFLGMALSKGKCFEIDCHVCQGVGAISRERQSRYVRGQMFRNLRVAARIGLRECAELAGILPSDLAKMQNGELEVSEAAWDALKPGERA